jgi:hypothetical protein
MPTPSSSLMEPRAWRFRRIGDTSKSSLSTSVPSYAQLFAYYKRHNSHSFTAPDLRANSGANPGAS